jgi:hypothetical protein
MIIVSWPFPPEYHFRDRRGPRRSPQPAVRRHRSLRWTCWRGGEGCGQEACHEVVRGEEPAFGEGLSWITPLEIQLPRLSAIELSLFYHFACTIPQGGTGGGLSRSWYAPVLSDGQGIAAQIGAGRRGCKRDGRIALSCPSGQQRRNSTSERRASAGPVA